jgi:putative membrane protein
MNHFLAMTAAAAIGLMGSSCAMMQKAAPGTLSDANMISVMNTADRADIEGGHLAQSKGTNPKVQAYGRQMVDDHSASLNQSKQLSQRLNIAPVAPALAEKLMTDHDETMQSLRSKTGSDFDRSYIEHEIEMHEQLIKLVDNAAGSADNAAVKQHLLRAKPKLQSHLESARGIKRMLVAQTN